MGKVENTRMINASGPNTSLGRVYDTIVLRWLSQEEILLNPSSLW